MGTETSTWTHWLLKEQPVGGCWTRWRIWPIRSSGQVASHSTFTQLDDSSRCVSRYHRQVSDHRCSWKRAHTVAGLPYAIRQAGFVTGLILLVVLSGVTDWTIRLIVINAKMSGQNSYIGIMNHCFGSSGRAAVSFFQFAFAFGGTRTKAVISVSPDTKCV